MASMFLQKAMRYYRFWIYSCNSALFVGTMLFIIAFVWIFSDARMTLFPSVRLYQPTFLYAYVALLVQGGILQTIGCLGAVRMNEKLLNIYLCTIIALLFGDAIVGIVWMLRYNSLTSNLRGELKSKLSNEYDIDTHFQVLWDRIQSESHCCGIDGPYDYNMTQWMVKQAESQSSRLHLVPKSCCQIDFDPSLPENLPIKERCFESYDPELVYTYGCFDRVAQWLQKCASTLFVLGFCVISFIKVCFLCILRYEIKEMIEKINVLKEMEEVQTQVHDLEAYLPRPSVTQETTQILANQTPQTSYRSACATEKHHNCLYHHHFGHGIATRSTNGNNNDLLNISLSKKHSIV